jgi:hypothetical protein
MFDLFLMAMFPPWKQQQPCYCFDSARKFQAIAEVISAFKQIFVRTMPFRLASLTPLLVTVPFAATLLVGSDLREVAEVRVFTRRFGHMRSTVLVGFSAGVAGLLFAGALAGQVGAIVGEHVAAKPWNMSPLIPFYLR